MGIALERSLAALALIGALAGCSRSPLNRPTRSPLDGGGAPDAAVPSLPGELAPLPAKCDAGDVESCRKLADAYRGGTGVPRDPMRARLVLERACERGQGRSALCEDLAVDYREGVGVPHDEEKARAVLERACDGQVLRACGLLGVIYTEGLGVPYAPPFQRIGFGYFERACKGGHPSSCWHLGQLLKSGIGTTRDPVRARAMFQRACELGDPAACDELKPKTKPKR
jgi:TPR repeat protein